MQNTRYLKLATISMSLVLPPVAVWAVYSWWDWRGFSLGPCSIFPVYAVIVVLTTVAGKHRLAAIIGGATVTAGLTMAVLLTRVSLEEYPFWDLKTRLFVDLGFPFVSAVIGGFGSNWILRALIGTAKK